MWPPRPKARPQPFLNAPIEQAQCPFWVGSMPLVSRLNAPRESAQMEVWATGKWSCWSEQWQMSLYVSCNDSFLWSKLSQPFVLYIYWHCVPNGIACRMALRCVRAEWHCVACVPDGVACVRSGWRCVRAFQMASPVISEWKVYRTAIVIFGNLSEFISRWKSL